MDTLWGISAELSRTIFVVFLTTWLLDRSGPSGYAVRREARKGCRRFSGSGPYGDISQKRASYAEALEIIKKEIVGLLTKYSLIHFVHFHFLFRV